MKLSGSATGLDDTREEIHESGYRRFVGGAGDYWELIGQLQFRFLVDHGLAPSETFVDVGCGALRGGVKLIRYLAPDRYLGIDKHIELIIYGVANELGIDRIGKSGRASSCLRVSNFTDSTQSPLSGLHSRSLPISPPMTWPCACGN